MSLAVRNNYQKQVAESKEKVGRWLDSVNDSSPVLKMSAADLNRSDISVGNQISVIEVLAANPDRSGDGVGGPVSCCGCGSSC